LKTVKLASTGYLDNLPTTGNRDGQAFRDLDMEAKIEKAAAKAGYGAQFGGKYFALDARVIRLPRHGASCPVGMGVSCSADRNIKAKINKDGIWLEQMEDNPGRFIRKIRGKHDQECQDQSEPSHEGDSCRTHQVPGDHSAVPYGNHHCGSGYRPCQAQGNGSTRGKGFPSTSRTTPVYYAGPAKTPKGKPSGSFGPTTAGRMDSYVDLFQSHGGSLVMIAKGNRSQQVTDACKKHGGFYLGSIGGAAALLAEENIKKVEVVEYPELGMEAIWKIEVEDFPAFILVDDKGNDFFQADCLLRLSRD